VVCPPLTAFGRTGQRSMQKSHAGSPCKSFKSSLTSFFRFYRAVIYLSQMGYIKTLYKRFSMVRKYPLKDRRALGITAGELVLTGFFMLSLYGSLTGLPETLGILSFVVMLICTGIGDVQVPGFALGSMSLLKNCRNDIGSHQYESPMGAPTWHWVNLGAHMVISRSAAERKLSNRGDRNRPSGPRSFHYRYGAMFGTECAALF